MTTNWRPLTGTQENRGDIRDDPPFGAYAPGRFVTALLWVTRRSILRRGVFRARIAQWVMRLNGGRIDLRFRGAAYRVIGNTNLIETGLMLVPEYNGAEIDFLSDGAPSDAAFVDIGSNVGLYSLPIALSHPAGRVVAIDANPRMVSALSWNARASGLANVACIHAAVSDREGRADLVIRRDDLAIVAVRENPDGAMPVRPLAAILADLGLDRVHGLKIDVEGHEDKALVPFLEVAGDAQLPRRIVIETAGPGEDYPGCTAVFARRGYVLKFRTRNNSCYALET